VNDEEKVTKINEARRKLYDAMKPHILAYWGEVLPIHGDMDLVTLDVSDALIHLMTSEHVKNSFIHAAATDATFAAFAARMFALITTTGRRTGELHAFYIKEHLDPEKFQEGLQASKNVADSKLHIEYLREKARGPQ